MNSIKQYMNSAKQCVNSEPHVRLLFMRKKKEEEENADVRKRAMQTVTL